MSQESFEIRPGHINNVALTATSVTAEDDLSDLSIDDRKCKFRNETQGVTNFKDYGYFNCILDCSIGFAKKVVSFIIVINVWPATLFQD